MLFCSPGWKQSTTLLSPNRRPADPPFDRLSAPLCPRPCRPIRQLRWGADASAAERARRGRHKTTFARPSGRVPTHRSRPAPLRRQASGRLNRTMPPPRPVDCFSAIPPSLPPSLPLLLLRSTSSSLTGWQTQLVTLSSTQDQVPPLGPCHIKERPTLPACQTADRGCDISVSLPTPPSIDAGIGSRSVAVQSARALSGLRPALRVSRIDSRQAEPVPKPPAPPAHPLTPRARDTRGSGPGRRRRRRRRSSSRRRRWPGRRRRCRPP